MAKRRTDKSCYESHYGGNWITARQRLAEMACERIAASAGKGLPSLFWRRAEWAKIFRRELSHADKLLGAFAVEAVFRAWGSSRANFLHTLGGPFFKGLVDEQHRLMAAEKQRLSAAPLPEPVNTLETPRPMRRSNKSIREKLNNNGPTQRGLFDEEAREDEVQHPE